MMWIVVEFFLLIFVCLSELCFVCWDEFDFDKFFWCILVKREEIKGVCYFYCGMKMKEEYIVLFSW